MTAIRMTSHMAAVADPFMRWLADELEVAWVDGSWTERLSSMSTGDVELGWVCGLLHACRMTRSDWPFTALAAPVMISERHGHKAQYFGDVIVSDRSHARSLEDLTGAVFAYNETTSLSGYRMLLNRLGSLRQFERAVASGSHAESLSMVMSGAADVAVIDSTVMDMMRIAGFGPVDEVHAIEKLGPYPMPPVVASRNVAPLLLAEMRERFESLHLDDTARTTLAAWGVSRFEPVSDDAYRKLASDCEAVL